MNNDPSKATWASALSLLTSMSTLVCCTLPALFVALGAGAVLAGLVTAVPQLIWLSAHKKAVFAVAAVMLAGAGWMQWKSRYAACPADPAKAASCERLRRISRVLYGVSVLVYTIGFFFAFIAADIFS